MSDVPKKLVVNVADGTSQYIDLTPEEIQQRELDAIAAATAQAEREEEAAALEALKTSARAKLVAGETLTEEEAAVLVI
jgi:hypothetical protein